jgi:hypothetical protein
VPPDMISQARSQLERELHPNDQLSLSPGDNSSESDEKGASQKRETDDSLPTCPPLSSPVPAGHGSCWHHANPWLGRQKKEPKQRSQAAAARDRCLVSAQQPRV